MSDINNFCRLCCGELNDNGLSIFECEGRRRFVEDKIKRYLHFSVSADDDLPKKICHSCGRKLDSIHKFASMAYFTQNQLRSRLGLGAVDSCKIPRLPHFLPTVFDKKQKITVEKDVVSQTCNEALFTDAGCEFMEMEVDPNQLLAGYDDYVDQDAEIPEEWNNVNPLNGIHCGEKNPVFTKQKHYRCSDCPREIVLELSLKNHFMVHKDEFPYSSQNRAEDESEERNRCNVFPVPPEGRREEEDWNTGVGFENNQCGVCRINFASQNDLEIHLDEHKAKGKFGCSVCSRVFKSERNLVRHQFYHALQYQDYACYICNRVYATPSALRYHVVSHSKDRCHKCTLCPKTFKRKQDLTFHMKHHASERPFSCPFCPQNFTSSVRSLSHQRRKHPTDDRLKQTSP